MKAAPAAGRPRRSWIPHLVLGLGVFVTAFPLWVAFVASTLIPMTPAQTVSDAADSVALGAMFAAYPACEVPAGGRVEDYCTVGAK